ncbi:MAG: hydrogenase/urease accessory protein HupE [Paracoccaceae bacterium]|jgi:hydrogenase/urease accessory protein HupE
MKNKLGIFTIAALTAATSTAHAHPGTEVGGGFLHPMAGVDHLAALLASAPVGLLIAGGVVIASAVIGAGIMIRRSRQS